MGIRAVFINAKEQREVAAGTTVFAEGDTGGEMYGLISGAVELRKGEQSLGVLEPGDTFGELAIVSEAPRSLTALATEQSVLAVIDDKAFLFLVHETPTFALDGRPDPRPRPPRLIRSRYCLLDQASNSLIQERAVWERWLWTGCVIVGAVAGFTVLAAVIELGL